MSELHRYRDIVYAPSLGHSLTEWANELTEVHLEVDHDMVCAMHDLTHAMGCMNVGVLLVVGVGAPGVSVGVGWLSEYEEGASKEKRKGKERAVVEDEGGCRG